mmetsp:Transcript_18401/g.42245  ORF Transcript_18401/g.42245 Transcript_18401/m.42245 type:complete len:236 (-) Transcript_18401:34-741(-)
MGERRRGKFPGRSPQASRWWQTIPGRPPERWRARRGGIRRWRWNLRWSFRFRFRFHWHRHLRCREGAPGSRGADRSPPRIQNRWPGPIRSGASIYRPAKAIVMTTAKVMATGAGWRGSSRRPPRTSAARTRIRRWHSVPLLLSLLLQTGLRPSIPERAARRPGLADQRHRRRRRRRGNRCGAMPASSSSSSKIREATPSLSRSSFWTLLPRCWLSSRAVAMVCCSPFAVRRSIVV